MNADTLWQVTARNDIARDIIAVSPPSLDSGERLLVRGRRARRRGAYLSRRGAYLISAPCPAPPPGQWPIRYIDTSTVTRG